MCHTAPKQNISTVSRKLCDQGQFGTSTHLWTQPEFYILCVCMCSVCFSDRFVKTRRRTSIGDVKSVRFRLICWWLLPDPLMFNVSTDPSKPSKPSDPLDAVVTSEPTKPSDPLLSWLHLQSAENTSSHAPLQNTDRVQGNQRQPTSNNLHHHWTTPSPTLQSVSELLTCNFSINLSVYLLLLTSQLHSFLFAIYAT